MPSPLPEGSMMLLAVTLVAFSAAQGPAPVSDVPFVTSKPSTGFPHVSVATTSTGGTTPTGPNAARVAPGVVTAGDGGDQLGVPEGPPLTILTPVLGSEPAPVPAPTTFPFIMATTAQAHDGSTGSENGTAVLPALTPAPDTSTESPMAMDPPTKPSTGHSTAPTATSAADGSGTDDRAVIAVMVALSSLLVIIFIIIVLCMLRFKKHKQAGSHSNSFRLSNGRADDTGILYFICVYLSPPPLPAILAGLFVLAPVCPQQYLCDPPSCAQRINAE